MENKPIAYVDREFKLYHPHCYNNLISTPENPKPELNRMLYKASKSVCTICGLKIRNK